MDLGYKFKNIRFINNISQTKMAEILGINRQYLSRIERNKSLPDTKVLTRLANIFHISIDSLLEINYNNSGRLRAKKIKEIKEYCSCLNDAELDFIINMIYVMNNN